MIFIKEDYGELLDKLYDINTAMHDEKVVTNLDEDTFNILNSFGENYAVAYERLLEARGDKTTKKGIPLFLQALSNKMVFNYFINTCAGEYQIYDDIGTGRVSYVPYQPVAEYFFEDERKKVVLMDYLKHEISHIFNKGTRVK